VIPIDGRPHLSNRIGLWQGDSRGHWEGSTLVVDTTNFSTKSTFMGSAEGLHLVERFTRTGPDAMTYSITVDDPTTWTARWTAVIRLRRTDDLLYESACHEGNHYVIRGILDAAGSATTGR
jgi:hypothetical protein